MEFTQPPVNLLKYVSLTLTYMCVAKETALM